MNIYIGNLSFNSKEDDVRRVFATYGQVSSVAIIKDKETGKSRGFGFVEMPNDEEGRTAITALNGKELDGRTLTVNEARPRAEGEGRGGSRRPGGGGGGNRGGYGDKNRNKSGW